MAALPRGAAGARTQETSLVFPKHARPMVEKSAGVHTPIGRSAEWTIRTLDPVLLRAVPSPSCGREEVLSTGRRVITESRRSGRNGPGRAAVAMSVGVCDANAAMQ
jgi:hypothetical protein